MAKYRLEFFIKMNPSDVFHHHKMRGIKRKSHMTSNNDVTSYFES